jgi:hypothetical protein
VNRAKAFERYWSEFERPLRPAEEGLPAPPGIAGAVATASALRRYSEAIPRMDLDSAWEGLVARLDTIDSPETVTSIEAAQRNGRVQGRAVPLLRPRRRGGARAAFAAVAAVVALCTMSLRASPGSALYPVRRTVERAALALSPKDRAIHLRVATARLDDLLASLREGPVQSAPGLARSLIVTRAAAGRAGADLRDLDLRIALEVPPALEAVLPSTASLVRTILGDLLPPEQSPAQGPRSIPGPGDHANKDKDAKKENQRQEREGSNKDADEQQGRRSGDDGQGKNQDSDSGNGSGSADDSGDHDSDSGQGSGDDDSGQNEGSGQEDPSDDGDKLEEDGSGPGDGHGDSGEGSPGDD